MEVGKTVYRYVVRKNSPDGLVTVRTFRTNDGEFAARVIGRDTKVHGLLRVRRTVSESSMQVKF